MICAIYSKERCKDKYTYIMINLLVKLWLNVLPIPVQFDGGVGQHAQHQPHRGALVAVNSQQSGLVAATHHHQVPRAPRVSALQFHRLATNSTYTLTSRCL